MRKTEDSHDNLGQILRPFFPGGALDDSLSWSTAFGSELEGFANSKMREMFIDFLVIYNLSFELL
jgi:hypothetical protein